MDPLNIMHGREEHGGGPYLAATRQTHLRTLSFRVAFRHQQD